MAKFYVIRYQVDGLSHLLTSTITTDEFNELVFYSHSSGKLYVFCKKFHSIKDMFLLLQNLKKSTSHI